MLPSALRTLRGMAYVIKAAGGCIGVDWAAVINAKEFEETKAKLGSGRGGSAKRKTAVDPNKVHEAAKAKGWPDKKKNKGIKRDLAVDFDLSDGQIGRILKPFSA